ncbi:MAG TPA: CDP-alcohol phosphatidyltransferase family protein [Dongiaceae bacterium]|jgi:phosphatidylglycerophosphate synthase|nr:CDP-alcohol phosphatidyltransferase family protein [Dongiaceae bacterium]
MFVVWIDAAHGAGERVYGMTLIERHLKALKHRKVQPAEVILDLGSSSIGGLDEAKRRWPFPVRVVRNSGTVAQRLARSAIAHRVLALDARTLVDARLYDFMTAQSRDLVAEDGAAAMAWIADPNSLDPSATDLLAALPPSLPRLTQAEFPGFIRNLRRTLPFYLFRIENGEARAKVERFLFWSNYKGSTDFFTKYVYPPLVWLLVPPLARAHVHPNWVTIISIILTFAAVPLFGGGHFLAGFLCAYGMSVLDSVDGKLARLTFTDSKIGNVLDHGLDLVHPPFWYCAWAYGLAPGTGDGDVWSPVFLASVVMLVLYVIDRLILKIYPTRFGRGLHAHAAMDGFVRTFISRRNINLPLFTVGYLAGLGVETIYLIVLWQAATCVYHGARTAWILTYDRPAAMKSA